jgi:flagellar hook assembly protein FlgD
MKMKNLHKMILMVLLISPLFVGSGAFAQTPGTLTCTYTTTFTGGGWGTKNCLAAWIETSSGTFIKTKFKYSKSGDLDHLGTFTSKPNYNNYIDAMTGNSRATNGLMTLIWNGTDLSTAVATDGVYKVWIEMAWGSSLTTGKTVQSFSFTKGTATDHQTGATTNFTGVTLDWVPTYVGLEENKSELNFSVTPNPVTNQSTINYSLNDMSDVTISLFDINGKRVRVLLDKNQNAGNYNLPFHSDVNPGVYFVKMYTGNTQHTERILITE